MQAPLPSKTVVVGTSRDSRENFMFGALFHQHQSLAYYVGLVKPLQKNLGYSQRYIYIPSSIKKAYVCVLLPKKGQCYWFITVSQIFSADPIMYRNSNFAFDLLGKNRIE